MRGMGALTVSLLLRVRASWLDAFYAFQYVWALRGVRVERQTRWIEDDW